MSIDDRTPIEARLTRTLQEVARLVPDEPDAAHLPDDHVVSLQPARETRHRTRIAVAAAVAVVLLLAGGALLLARGGSDDAARVDSPAASAPAPTTSTVADPNLVAVPNVVGRSLADAQSILGAAGFAATVTNVPSAQPAGTVVGQDPAAGGRAARGANLNLQVSGGS